MRASQPTTKKRKNRCAKDAASSRRRQSPARQPLQKPTRMRQKQHAAKSAAAAKPAPAGKVPPPAKGKPESPKAEKAKTVAPAPAAKKPAPPPAKPAPPAKPCTWQNLRIRLSPQPRRTAKPAVKAAQVKAHAKPAHKAVPARKASSGRQSQTACSREVCETGSEKASAQERQKALIKMARAGETACPCASSCYPRFTFQTSGDPEWSV